MHKRFSLLLITLLIGGLVVGGVKTAAAQDALDHGRAYRSSAQSISNASWTTVVFDTLATGSVGYWSSGLYYPITAAWYQVCSYVHFASTTALDATDIGSMRLLTSNSQALLVHRFSGTADDGGTVQFAVHGCALIKLAVDEWVAVQVYQSTGGSLNTAIGAEHVWMSVAELPNSIPYTPTPIPTDTPQPTPTTNATISALVTAIAGLTTPTATITPTTTITPTATVTPTMEVYLPIVVTDTLTSGNVWAFTRSVTAGEIAIAVVGLCLMGVGVFKMLVSLL